MDLKSFRARIGPALLFIIIAYQHDGVFVPVPLVPGCVVGGVDRREGVQVSATFFCPFRELSKMFDTFRPLAT